MSAAWVSPKSSRSSVISSAMPFMASQVLARAVLPTISKTCSRRSIWWALSSRWLSKTFLSSGSLAALAALPSERVPCFSAQYTSFKVS